MNTSKSKIQLYVDRVHPSMLVYSSDIPQFHRQADVILFGERIFIFDSINTVTNTLNYIEATTWTIAHSVEKPARGESALLTPDRFETPEDRARPNEIRNDPVVPPHKALASALFDLGCEINRAAAKAHQQP